MRESSNRRSYAKGTDDSNHQDAVYDAYPVNISKMTTLQFANLLNSVA